MEDWKMKHRGIMVLFLRFINNLSNDFILKGGTALMLCYSLDRFSEDIDLNGFNPNFLGIL